VAGLFYAGGAAALRSDVDALLAEATVRLPAPPAGPGTDLAGVLVPHAGLVYSGLVAATAWRLLGPSGEAPGGGPAPTGVLLGTNHGAAWLTGVGAWEGGPWRTPLGDVAIDRELVDAVLALGRPFEADAECHLGEHSIEVQLPFLQRLLPGARIVPLAVGTGTGERAISAGTRLGRLLAERRAAESSIVLAISTDMAHYPTHAVAARITDELAPHVPGLDPEGLAEAEVRVRHVERTSCGMCGIEPAVLGLAALQAMGAAPGVTVAAATSADAGGDPGRTVGYLAVAFPTG
jgi:hypothetical protein